MVAIVEQAFRDRSGLALAAQKAFAIGSEAGQASEVTITATPDGEGEPIVFTADVLLQTPREREYFRHGGILPYALRRLAAGG